MIWKHVSEVAETEARLETGEPGGPAAVAVAEIRYGLTARGEALVRERSRRRFSGFGPCPVAAPEQAERGPVPSPLTLELRT